MSDNQELPDSEERNVSAKNAKKKASPKDKREYLAPERSQLHDGLDPNCLYKFDNTLVRIEYPGNVKNIDKAIGYLGGIEEIQKAIDGKKLELCFHPKNQYMKGCVADIASNVGILVKVKQNNDTQKVSYEVLGATDTCFKFNRMCDFQYLPLLSKDKPETKESVVEYVHDKIMLEKIPNLEWFTKREPSTIPIFFISGAFARFDQPQGRFQLNSSETINSMVRADAPQLFDFGQKKTKPNIPIPTVRISFLKDIEVPDKPVPEALDNIKTKVLQHHLKTIQQFFNERPVWTKAGIAHKANIPLDSVKLVLPCVAYYCFGGPWRVCWIRFGYNPFKDHGSRIYQLLDFRIRRTEGMQIKVKAKRTTNIAKDFIIKKIGNTISDINYIIRPNQIPPARQMNYQYCDILLPEVQDMLAKLPKLPNSTKFDPKNGWLPMNFQEHCREIVNRYAFDAVQQELQKETRKQRGTDQGEDVATYCSKMLSNIKKGVSQSIGEYSSGQDTVIEEIYLSDDDEQVDANEVVDSLPERLSDNFDDEDEDSDLDIDMEAVEEVNDIVSGLSFNKS